MTVISNTSIQSVSRMYNLSMLNRVVYTVTTGLYRVKSVDIGVK